MRDRFDGSRLWNRVIVDENPTGGCMDGELDLIRLGWEGRRTGGEQFLPQRTPYVAGHHCVHPFAALVSGTVEDCRGRR